MPGNRYTFPIKLLILVLFTTNAQGDEKKQTTYDRQIDFFTMTPAEHTAARRQARDHHYEQITFCADPGNMPLSNVRQEGLQNKIALAVGKKMGTKVNFFWRPFFERGLTRETFDNNECEVIIEVPDGYGNIITSLPIYRSTYVFVTHETVEYTIDGFDDHDLHSRTVGVFQHSAMREALSRHGLKEGLDLHVLSYDADLRPEKQPWNQVRKVAEKQLDIAGVWGPFAGWLKQQGAPINLTPVNLMEDQVVLEFSMAFGIRRNDALLKYALDFALKDTKDEIEDILKAFGVPLVECAKCIVSGVLPAHGTYFDNIIERAQERYVSVVPDQHRQLDLTKATADQIVTLERLKKAISQGADPQTELNNAVLASDELRAAYLIAEHGADPNKADIQGMLPLVIAANNRNPQMIHLLVGHGAKLNNKGKGGLTALHSAVLRNHVPTIEALVEAGADMEITALSDLSPLALAISEGMRWASSALIDLGASVDSRTGKSGLTPLMMLATQDPAKSRNARVNGGPSVIEISEQLLSRGANINSITPDGVTALMVAAGVENNTMLAYLLKNGADADMKTTSGQTALDIAEVSRSTEAVKALRVLAKFK